MRPVRIRIDLAYDGTDFHGWATQPGLRTVQGELSAALATALRVASVDVVCAGRTDTGVHARGQVVHLDVDPTTSARSAGRSTDPPLEALLRRLNGILPADVRVRRAVEAADGLRRPLLRALASLRLPGGRRAGDGRPADPAARARLAAAARPRCAERGLGAARGRARLRVVLQAARRAPRPSGPCSSCPGSRDDGRDCWWRRCAPTRSATAWSARSSAACSPSAKGAASPPGPARSCGPRSRDPAVAVVHAHGLTLEEVAYPSDDELAARADRTRAKRVAHG